MSGMGAAHGIDRVARRWWSAPGRCIARLGWLPQPGPAEMVWWWAAGGWRRRRRDGRYRHLGRAGRYCQGRGGPVLTARSAVSQR
jgi:hypothetical protein